MNNVQNKLERIEIQSLYDELLANGAQIYDCHGYEVIDCNGIKIKTEGNRLVDLIKLSRHKTTKHLIKLTATSADSCTYIVTVTTDHVCMTYNRDHFFENIAAKDLQKNMFVALYDYENDREIQGTLIAIEDLGTTTDYVYDCEVDDDLHAFYANDILIHNSQFIPLDPVVNKMIAQYGLPEKIASWPQEKRQELWDVMTKFTDDEINAFVRGAVHEKFKTEMQNRLKYELEYMVDVGLYESMKHYFVHKIFDEGDAVSKVKVTGIELKKTVLDKDVKTLLKDIYEGVVLHDWNENDYKDYLSNLYERFKSYSVEQLSFWRGYNTAKEAAGFLLTEKGTTNIAKACQYYNQLLSKLNLGKKYDSIIIGDKVRQICIKPTNKYGINTIAYKPGQWPKEFDEIFEVDYQTIFKKIILDPLKRFREACNFSDYEPDKQVQCDVFDL